MTLALAKSPGLFEAGKAFAGGEETHSGMEAVQAAHWRAIQLLGGLAARCKPPGLSSTIAADSGLHALRWLNGCDVKVNTPPPPPSPPSPIPTP